MAGIHLPDIRKLGIHIATGIRDKKKVAPSNMAENARFQALSTRLDSEKHERSRVLKKEERRMKRKKHRIDKRRQDIQKDRKQESNSNVDTNNRKRFLPLIAHPKTVFNGYKDAADLLSEDRKDLDKSSSGPISAIFPIQDELSRLLDSAGGESRASEKRKIILPPIETGSGEGNSKYRKNAPLKKKSKKSNIKNRNNKISERNCAESSKRRNSKVLLNSPDETLTTLTISESTQRDLEELKFDTKDSSPARKKEIPNEDETAHVEIMDGTDSNIDESDPSNPFNYLLLEEQRRRSLHPNLEDAFRAIQACRYIRTPSRKEKEATDDEL